MPADRTLELFGDSPLFLGDPDETGGLRFDVGADGAITLTFLGSGASLSLSGATLDWGDVSGKPATYPPSSHTHDWSEVTGKPGSYPLADAATALATPRTIWGQSFDGTGDVTGGLVFSTNELSPVAGSVYRDGGNGLNFWGSVGSSHDLAWFNGAGSMVMTVPTGTQDLGLLGDFTVGGNVLIGGGSGLQFTPSGNTSGASFLRFNNTAGATKAVLGKQSNLAGAGTSDDLLIFAETGQKVHIAANGSATPVVTVDSDGLKFNADTAAANALDDYEEGSWTPTLATTGTALGSVTYSVREGSYTKTGRQVTAHCWVQTSAITVGGGSGQITITGLPYAAAAVAGGFAGAVGRVLGWGGDQPSAAMVLNTTTAVYLYHRTAANGETLSVDVGDLDTGAASNYIELTVTYEVA